jgi:hypothetical protein
MIAVAVIVVVVAVVVAMQVISAAEEDEQYIKRMLNMNANYSQMFPSSCSKCMLNPVSLSDIGPIQFHHAV